MWMPKANWASSSDGVPVCTRASMCASVIFGYTTTLDLTALDMLREESALSDPREEHRHVLQLRPGDRHGG